MNIKKPIFSDSIIKIGLIGEFQSGKSLLINCILGRPIATVGSGSATTHTIVNYHFSLTEYIEYINCKGVSCKANINELARLDTSDDISVIDVFIACELLRGVVLSDMPGFGANAADNKRTLEYLKELDCGILITSNDKAIGAESSSYKYIQYLKQYRIPYYFVLNCRDKDKWSCNDPLNTNIADYDRALLDFYPPKHYPMDDSGVNIVNLMWYWFSISDDNDKLINRPDIRYALTEYQITDDVKTEVGTASNFELIKNLFKMDNRAFLEILSELKKLKDEVCPIGSIQCFAFNNVPEGWLICDGQMVSADEYPLLYEAIGNTFGELSDGMFRVPDLRGRFIRGWDQSGFIDKDRKFGSPQSDSVSEHSHNVESCSENGRHYHYIGYKHYPTQEANVAYSTYQHEHVTDHSDSSKKGNRNTDSDGAHKHDIALGGMRNYGEIECHISNETRPKNVALLYCIKAT